MILHFSYSKTKKMNSLKTNAFLYSTIVAIGGFIFGLDAAVISGTVQYIAEEFSLNEWQIGFVVSAPGLGVMPALPLAGYISNKHGRKKALQLVALLYLISAIGSVLAPSYITLVAARFVGGLAFCSLSLAAMYIGEIAPPKWRGKLVSMNQINIVVGLSAAYFINYLIVQITGGDAEWVTSLGIRENTWRWMLGSEVIPAFIWLALLFTIPESPSWLVYADKIEAAKATLRKILPANEIEQHITEMKESMQQNDETHTFWEQFKQIFSKRMRLILLIGVTMALVQQITGINAILFYAPMVFEQLGGGTDTALVQAIWVGVISVIFTALALLVIDKIGRRPMIIWGLAWCIISLSICSYGFFSAQYELPAKAITELNEIKGIEKLNSLVGIQFNSDIEFKKELIKQLGEENTRKHSSVLLQKAAKLNAGLILFGVLSFIAAFQFSIGPVMWVLFSEIFPIALRGIAIPMFAFITSITSYFVQLFFPWQLANMGGGSVFLTYAVFGVIGFLILYRKLPETKSMSIEEIQDVLIKK